MRVLSVGALLGALVTLSACGGGGGGGSSPTPPPPPPPPQKTLFVATQPVGSVQATVFATQPVVHVRSNGVTDAADNATVVTASITAGTGTAGAQLTGTATATAVAGVATFTNLGVDTAGTNYQLRFTAPGITEIASTAFNVTAPVPVQVTFTIDSAQDVHPISRFIYGLNGWDPAQRPKNLGLSRSGGNRMTAYNWETNASNAGSDYFNQNDSFLGGGNTPNGAVAPGLEAARASGAGMIITMPTIGYVSADKASADKEDVNVTPNYLSVRFHQSPARKNAAFTMTPNTGDAFVYQDEYIYFLNQTYPGAFAAANNPLMISLDNEPDLWHTTHARLRGDAVNPPATQSGNNVTYAEIVQRSVDYASAAKDVNPAALIFGPANYGWQGYVRLQAAPDHNNRDFLEYYLASMLAAEPMAGRRLLDVLDVHWYPEAQGGGIRITGNETTAAVVEARKQAPRSLWDPNYTETSWITQSSTMGPIRLLPRLKDKIAANYPNTRLAITEYNYGAGDHISGGIAQADVLGIFGRENIFAATQWRFSGGNNFLYGAFDMYRNYDGTNGSFGDTSIRAATSDVATATVYASVNAGNANRMVVIAINKNDSARNAAVAVTHNVQFHTAQVYQLTSANSVPQRVADIAITQANAFQYSMPGNSVTTLVLLP